MSRFIDRSGKRFGEIEDAPVGTSFDGYKDLRNAGVHVMSQAGIHGSQREGAYSIVLNSHESRKSKGYNDIDRGRIIIYIGPGWNKSEVNPEQTEMQGRDIAALRTASESSGDGVDQKWTPGNRALLKSQWTQRPIRVIRGKDSPNSVLRPNEGYRYDGLYKVTNHRYVLNRQGRRICKFTLERLPHQLTIPNRATLPMPWPRLLHPSPSPPSSKSEENSGGTLSELESGRTEKGGDY
ncbi:hypothetical protein D9615_005023 [Tricholomella constricta]|uniref:YDG domain-containing protein n=1 Tax=Tricholomella constricta TaxID=117010 RepID=A0A8H5M738_9AGAR|nr:hypothetical protein D9615_005023 [Tricholomella constricta]